MPSNILITGVSRGLGRAMTSGFIKAGHIVWGCARDQVALDELGGRWPSPHQFAKVDTSRDADIARWAAEAQRQNFVPDLLINNAALVNKNARLWEVSADEFDRLMAVNISGVANVIRHFFARHAQARSWSDCQFQLGLGSFGFARSSAVLRDQMGDRRAYPGTS